MVPFKGSTSSWRNAGLDAMGIVAQPPSEADLDAVRRGARATVIAGIRCGECDAEWSDVFKPTGHKASVCPGCGATNRIFRDWMAH